MMFGAERDNRRIASSTTSSNVMDFCGSALVAKVVAEDASKFSKFSVMFFFIFGRHV
jgi:hypothetical protein